MTDTYELTQQELDCIRELAYEKFVARGCEDGYHLEDWLAAEQEVRATAAGSACSNSVPETETKKSRRTGTAKSETAAVG